MAKNNTKLKTEKENEKKPAETKNVQVVDKNKNQEQAKAKQQEIGKENLIQVIEASDFEKYIIDYFYDGITAD